MADEELFVRTSERSDWMRCRQRWFWAYRDHLKAKRQAPALRFGTMVHSSLEKFYPPQTLASWKKNGPRRGPLPFKTFLKVYDADVIANGELGFRVEDNEEWIDARDLGVEMLKNYVDFYGKDDTLRVVAPEHAFQFDLHDESGVYVCTYVGQLDVVAQNMTTNEFGFVDHKTAANLGTDHLSLDEQASSYDAFAPYILPELGIDAQIDFVMFNILRKAKKDTRPENELGQKLNKPTKQHPKGEVSKNQPAPLFKRHLVYRSDHERRALMKRVIDQVKEMRQVDEGTLEVIKSPLNGCTGMFGCQFRDMCELHETGSDWKSFRKGMFDTWSPYEAHEITEGEKG